MEFTVLSILLLFSGVLSKDFVPFPINTLFGDFIRELHSCLHANLPI